MKAPHIALAIGLSCAALTAPASAAVSYALTDLGALPGGANSWAYGINDSGKVAGSSQATGGQRATTWENDTLTALDRIGTFAAQANDINNNGVAAGYTNNRAAIWNGTTPTALGALAGSSLSQATSINDSGQVVGYSDGGGNSGYRAVSWADSASSPTQLQTLGAGDSFAQDINSSGQIVGISASRAVLWNDSASSPVNLGVRPGDSISYAFSINDIGQVVGYSGINSNSTHAALWDNGVLTDLGALAGHSISQAFGINELGQIVGFSTTTNTAVNNRATLWSNGVLSDLNTLIDPSLGWTLRRAESINGSGQIVGYGVNASGQTRAFLLTAVPEPATWAMMITGFGLTGAAMRRRRSGAGELQAA